MVKKQVSREEMREIIDDCVRLLRMSERGRDVAVDLHVLLQGRISGLDGQGWDAVEFLLRAYRGDWTGTVLGVLADLEGGG